MTGAMINIGYTFKNKSLLEQALTHRSHSSRHNERLEFLGDSVLNCAIASLLYDRFARIDEGDLSRLRANLVKQASLAEIAQRIELSRFLRLGEGELKSGGFRRPSILADTLEAIFGAIFMDGGFDAACAVIARLYQPVLETVDPKTLGKDAKTLLQEYLQGRKIALPVYTVLATHGAAHSQEFEVECAIPKLDVQVVGIGGSRRAAEQAAAKQALEAALAANPSPARRVPKARKTAQLSLPVAVAQEANDDAAPPAEPRQSPPPAARIVASRDIASGASPPPTESDTARSAAPQKNPHAAPSAALPPEGALFALGRPAGKK
ncbi:Ribonuclease 3 [Pigmentiphaga humi]|uniref:Ribonuclease 3 n=1 Tax=Pigmentiphaga humi TaxID=2478468 RepID=A0A3P4B915_9BURK|nr:ribonuclease III [Pigmentiphaga humi]VCU72100.1 Ribonuclease 3 [Pigmentiphaga humi]